jgi:hypothetical protein
MALVGNANFQYSNHIMNTETLKIRRANERGHADHGWLESRHTFSFADYYDPAHMGFRSLRVINDDRVAPRGGFPTHSHRDMEIFSYVLAGRLAHQDSMGNKRELKPGEIQLMRAGSGVSHSEFNPSATDEARFLQIWITPAQRGLEPAYTEWTPSQAASKISKQLVISSDAREGSARIAQDADIYRIDAGPDEVIEHILKPNRGMWLHIIRGTATLSEFTLHPGDAVSLEEPATLAIHAGPDGLEALLFDLR